MSLEQVKQQILKQLDDENIRDRTLIMNCPPGTGPLYLLTSACLALKPELMQRNVLPVIVTDSGDEEAFQDGTMLASMALVIASEHMTDIESDRYKLRANLLIAAAHRLGDMELEKGKEAAFDWVRSKFPNLKEMLQKLHKATKSDRN